MSSSAPVSHSSPEIQTVMAWHAALNSGDTERLVALSHQDIEVGGPRGSDRGVHILREWVDRANIHLEPKRTFQQAGTVVVEQEAEWQASGPDGRQTVASIFVVDDGLVDSVVRHPDLTTALRAANPDGSHERIPANL